MPSASRSVRVRSLTVILAVITPVFILGVANYFQMREDLTDAALRHRESVAYLAAGIIRERLDRLVDTATALATRAGFREPVEAGNWNAAADAVRDVPANFEYIERIVIADPSGTIRGDTVTPSDIVGQNFAFRDWYRGVSAEWRPYVSEVYRVAAAPYYNSVVVAVPVRSGAGAVVGIIAVQVITDTFLEWARGIDAGPGGFVYFTDQRGQLIAHPKFPSQSDVVDFSSAPAVLRTLRGETGTGIFYNPLENSENVVAYSPVPVYGWGVVISQPVGDAFADRDRNLATILIVYGVISILAAFLAYAMMRLRRSEEDNIAFREGTLLHVVHDLRAPSNVIRLIVSQYTPEFLAKYPELKQDAERIQQANARMLNLIQYLFEIVKGERAGLEFRRDAVDLADIMDSALRELEPAIRARSIAILHKKLEKTPLILGDWDRLKEVFVNLIDNAVKYNRESGSITVSHAADGRTLAVSVRDTGLGIAKENLPKVFLPYFREGTSAAPGVGLGLSIVKNFVEKMGGTIRVESVLGEGTTFTLVFPIAL